MRDNDTGHELTEKELAKLEKRIAKVYRQAGKELQGTITDYFEKFKERDEEMKALIGTVVNGKEWTEQDYKHWRLNQMARGERYQAMREKVAKRMTAANEVAVSYTNDATPGIYSLNRNYAAYTIEQVSPDADFTLWDEQTVKRLIVDQPDLMPYYPKDRAVKRGIDLAYGKKQITASVTSSILQGKSIKGIADDLQGRITTMNRSSAIRTARTAVTGAQNAGRMDSYAAAERMGISLKKRWMATLDGRTRHSHARLDGETVLPGEAFSNGCRFPGDPQGPAHEVYNCRCVLVAELPGMGVKDAPRRARSPLTGQNEVVPGQTFEQWAKEKTRARQKAIKPVSASFAGTSGLAQKFQAGMSAALKKSSHAEVKSVFAKYQDQIKCVDSHHQGGAYFSGMNGGIYFDEGSAAAGSSYQEPYQVAFHEFGHNIDWLMGGKNLFDYASNKEYNGVRLETVIKNDYLAFKKASGKKKNDDLIAMLKAENMPLTECGNISDILEYCTNKSYPLGVGHGVKYHKRPGATEKEFFAEVLDSAASNEKAYLQMKRIFPNATQMVLDIIGGKI